MNNIYYTNQFIANGQVVHVGVPFYTVGQPQIFYRPKRRCRVKNCKAKSCLAGKPHYCKYCKKKDVSHFSYQCPKLKRFIPKGGCKIPSSVPLDVKKAIAVENIKRRCMLL